jgi:hypothetical protein
MDISELKNDSGRLQAVALAVRAARRRASHRASPSVSIATWNK